MKKLRTYLASLLIMAGAVTAQADDYKYLSIAQDNGGAVDFSITNISRITFDASNMIVHLSDGSTQSLPLSNLQRMFFSTTPSGIQSVTQSRMSFSGGVLRADIAAGERIEIYDMGGQRVFSSNQSGTFDLTTLTKGIYIVKVGSETRKVVNK